MYVIYIYTYVYTRCNANDQAAHKNLSFQIQTSWNICHFVIGQGYRFEITHGTGARPRMKVQSDAPLDKFVNHQ